MAVVMIVEDEALIRFALADELIACGHMVIECCNVLEALAVLGKSAEIDAVVTDVDMPGGLSGLDLSRLLAATSPSLPVWITSGRDVDISALGAAVFLPKPYDMRALACEIAQRAEMPAERSASFG
ncbi:response regulator [Rhizobium sp. Rhizsp82]|uniref:response regulator n=1 Tax=Rhizobium sp. Rhizsp82 TaxID=3243057 RepID=UPI0039B6A2FE